jgi:hypothetical protein
LAQPPSVLPAAQKWYEALLCIQKSFLTFGILYNVGNSFYVLPTDRHPMAFFTLHSLCVYVCVLFYLQRALYVPHGDHVDFLNKNIGITPVDERQILNLNPKSGMCVLELCNFIWGPAVGCFENRS